MGDNVLQREEKVVVVVVRGGEGTLTPPPVDSLSFPSLAHLPTSVGLSSFFRIPCPAARDPTPVASTLEEYEQLYLPSSLPCPRVGIHPSPTSVGLSSFSSTSRTAATGLVKMCLKAWRRARYGAGSSWNGDRVLWRHTAAGMATGTGEPRRWTWALAESRRSTLACRNTVYDPVPPATPMLPAPSPPHLRVYVVAQVHGPIPTSPTHNDSSAGA